jgi:hypothetical protein
MAAEAHNRVCSTSVSPTKVAHPLDEMARGLPSGSLVQGEPIINGQVAYRHVLCPSRY